MDNFKLKDPGNPFKMRTGERIVDLKKYIENLKRYDIKYTNEQYEEVKKQIETKGYFE